MSVRFVSFRRQFTLDTGKPYRWTDKPLLEISWQELPLVEPKFIKAVFTSKHLSELMTGSETHDATLMLVAQLAKISDDYDYIKRVVTACFPENYAGDLLKELPGMIRDTAKKFETSQWTKAKTVAAGFPDVTKNGWPRPTLPNTKVAITRSWVWSADMTCSSCGTSSTDTEIESFVGDVSDPALLRLRELIYERFGFDPSTSTVHAAVQTLANHHRFHPVRDYLDGLNGMASAHRQLADQLRWGRGHEYMRAVGALMLTAAVRRVRGPGCKFDETLVLEEPEQGNNRSEPPSGCWRWNPNGSATT